MSRYAWTPPAPAPAAPAPVRPERKPATVRPEWRMPEPPPGGPWVATVVDTGDGWCPCWESDDYATAGATGENLIVGEDGWPFVENFARASDWRALGFEVE